MVTYPRIRRRAIQVDHGAKGEQVVTGVTRISSPRGVHSHESLYKQRFLLLQGATIRNPGVSDGNNALACAGTASLALAADSFKTAARTI